LELSKRILAFQVRADNALELSTALFESRHIAELVVDDVERLKHLLQNSGSSIDIVVFDPLRQTGHRYDLISAIKELISHRVPVVVVSENAHLVSSYNHGAEIVFSGPNRFRDFAQKAEYIHVVQAYV
jgi:hypothetical protein